MTNALRHFIDLSILTPQTARTIIDYAAIFKTTFKAWQNSQPFVGKTLAMIFENRLHALAFHLISACNSLVEKR
ncbi:ornithine carbamoyltransferase [Bartonella sp. WD12.1]|nr:ornithine carbamoyltransferase [Bartonella sp. WD12.1]